MLFVQQEMCPATSILSLILTREALANLLFPRLLTVYEGTTFGGPI